MRLEGNFYNIDSIIEVSTDSYRVEVTLAPEHEIYKGHFPSQAVVPGVCTLTIIRECLSSILAREVSFSTIKECKYVSALLPQQDLRITINLTLTDGTKLRANVERCDNDQSVLKLRADIR